MCRAGVAPATHIILCVDDVLSRGVGKSLPDTNLRQLASEWLQRVLREVEGPKNGRWTQTGLAARAEVSRQAIWAILKMRADPKPETIRAIAGVLGLPMPGLYESLPTGSAPPPTRLPGSRSTPAGDEERPAAPYGQGRPDARLTGRPQVPAGMSPPIADNYDTLSSGKLWDMLCGAIKAEGRPELTKRLYEAWEAAVEREQRRKR